MNNSLKIFVLLFFFFGLTPIICSGEEMQSVADAIEAMSQAAVKKDYKEVMALFAAVTDYPELTPAQRARIFYLRGCAYQMITKEYSLAITDYSQSIEIDGEEKWTFSSLVNRAGCYLDLQEYDKALGDIEEALKIWPEHQVALNKKQLILMAMQATQEGN